MCCEDIFCDVNLIEEEDHRDSGDSCEMPSAHQRRVVNAKPSPNWARQGIPTGHGHPNYAQDLTHIHTNTSTNTNLLGTKGHPNHAPT